MIVTTTGTTTPEYHYQRVDSAGQVNPAQVPAALTGKPIVRSASTGNTWAFLTANGTSASDVYVLSPDLTLRGAPTQLPWAASQTSLIPGPEQYAVLEYQSSVVRIDEDDAAPIDMAPIKLTKYVTTGSGAYYDGKYYFLSGGFRTLRLDAQTGVVLDPDDDFNEASGAKSFYTPPGTISVSSLKMSALQGGPVVNFQSTSGQVRQIALDPATGLAKNPGSPAVDVATFGTSGGTSFSFFANPPGDAWILVDRNQAFRYGPAVSNLLSPTSTNFNRWAPAVGSNGSNYLVAYELSEQSGGGVQGVRTVLATLVSGTTGESLATPFSLGTGYFPVVASNGTAYMVFWWTGDRVQFIRVSATGTVQSTAKGHDSTGVITSAGHNGVNYYVTFGSKLYRITDLGGNLDASGITTISSSFAVHDTTPEPDLRTLLVVGSDGTNVIDQRVRSATGAALSSRTVLPNHGYPLGASDGTHALVVARQTNTSNYTGVLVDFLSGDPIPGTQRTLFTVDGQSTISRVFFDGTAFAVVINEVKIGGIGPRSALYLRRFDPTTLEPLDAEVAGYGVPLTSEPHAYAGQYTLAARTPGESLLVTHATDISRLGSALHAYFIHPEGSPGGSGGSGSGGASSGGGTSSGGASTGGDASTGGTSSGGATSTGGTSSGGATSTGGAPSGGATSTGGDTSTGGIATGGTSSGGSSSTRRRHQLRWHFQWRRHKHRRCVGWWNVFRRRHIDRWRKRHRRRFEQRRHQLRWRINGRNLFWRRHIDRRSLFWRRRRSRRRRQQGRRCGGHVIVRRLLGADDAVPFE